MGQNSLVNTPNHNLSRPSTEPVKCWDKRMHGSHGVLQLDHFWFSLWYIHRSDGGGVSRLALGARLDKGSVCTTPCSCSNYARIRRQSGEARRQRACAMLGSPSLGHKMEGNMASHTLVPSCTYFAGKLPNKQRGQTLPFVIYILINGVKAGEMAKSLNSGALASGTVNVILRQQHLLPH